MGDWVQSNGRLELRHQGTDFLEVGVVGGLGPLEQSGFGCGEDRPTPFQSPEGDLRVILVTRSHGISHNLDMEVLGQKLKSRLSNADVSLNPRESHMGDLVGEQVFQDRRHRAAVKGNLLGPVRDKVRNRLVGRPQSFRILFGRHDRDSEQLGRSNQSNAVRHDQRPFGHLVQELVLNIYDQKGRTFGRHSASHRHF